MAYNIEEKLHEIEAVSETDLRRSLFDFFFELDPELKPAIATTLVQHRFDPDFLLDALTTVIVTYDKTTSEIILNSLIDLVDGRMDLLDLPGLLFLLTGALGKETVEDTYRQYSITDTTYKNRLNYYFHD